MANVIVNDEKNYIVLNGVEFSTSDYDEGTKFKRETQRKSAYVSLGDMSPEDKEALEAFGVSIYTPKDKKASDFIIVPFSGKSAVFYMDTMTKLSNIVFDKSMPNFKVINSQIAITRNDSDAGQTFFRIPSFKVPTHADVQNFVSDFFGDADEFAEIENTDDTKPQQLLN